MIEVRNSKIHGKGVFALKDFKIGETVVTNMVITFSKENLNDSIIKYCYRWKDNDVCIFIGEGVFINSSKKPNVKVYLDFDSKIARFIAINPIKEGDELFYNYYF